jgi:Tfp pilus assembly protein PilX
MPSPRNRVDRYLIFLLVRLHAKGSHSKGYTLVVTIAMLLILSVLLITYAVTSKVDNAASMYSAKSNTGFYTAEAGINLRAKQIRAIFDSRITPAGTPPTGWKDCLDTSTTNDGTGSYACNIQTFTLPNATKDSFANQIGNQRVITYVQPDTANNPSNIVIPAGESFAGLSAQENRYDVFSVSLDNRDTPTAILDMQVKSRLIPLFQFAAFYDQDMDFDIPFNMTLNGLVHSNNDLYLDAAGGNTLAITGQVSTAGALFRGEKHKNSCRGTVSINDPSTPRSLPCAGNRREFTSSNVRAWNNQIRIGAQKLLVPLPEEFNATPGKLYWDSADLRIVLDLTTTSPSIQVRSQSDALLSTETNTLTSATCAPTQTTVASAAIAGNTVVTVTNATGFSPGDKITLGTDPHLYVVQSVIGTTLTLTKPLLTDIPTGTVFLKSIVSFSDKTFKNYREKRGTSGSGRSDHTPIQMLNVDIQGLLACADQTVGNLMGGKLINDTSSGGLVWFLTVKGPDSNTINDYGVRIYNGSNLSGTVGGRTMEGLSIISDQAVYIQGDYNCGPSGNCKSRNLDDDVRKPAAIMADSINVLSNAWPLDDSFSDREISQEASGSAPQQRIMNRPATETTVNAAFLAGIDITGGANGRTFQGKGNSGGGVNNYPRFHEDWRNGVTDSDQVIFHYQGSLVSLGAPTKVNGLFCGSGSMNGDCNIYNPPDRDWRFDPYFKDAENMPPIAPQVVYLKQEIFSRNFDQASLLRPQSVSLWRMLLPSHVLGVLGALAQSHH